MAQPGITRAVCAGAFALIATSAFAHHPGGTSNTGGAGPITTISASTLEAGHGAVAFLSEYLKFGGLSNADLIAAAAAHIHAHSIGSIRSTSLSAAYGVTDDFMVAVRLPYVQRFDIREGHHSHGPAGNTVDFRGNSEGIGDLTLLGQYRFFNNRATRTEAAFLFGVKAPTGATNRIDQQGLLFDAEFQPGSGSWDVLLGAAFTQRFGAWSFDTNVLGILAGRGTQDTRLGDRVLYNAAVSYRLVGYAPPSEQYAALPASAMAHGPVKHRHAHPLDKIPAPAAPQWTVDAMLELNGEWHGYQDTAGVVDLNSGGHVLLLSPGLRIAYGGFSGFATFGIPIVNQMNGLQSKTEYRVFTGVAYAF